LLRDVQATRIQWLEDRWVEYHELKDKLVSDAPKLRIFLAQEAIDERARASAGRGGMFGGGGGKGRPQTADQKATSAMEAATRYRASQRRGGSGGGGGGAAATPAQQKAMSAMEAAAAYRANKK